MAHKEVCSLALIGGEELFLDPTPLGSCGEFPLMESQHLEGPKGTKESTRTGPKGTLSLLVPLSVGSPLAEIVRNFLGV